MDSGNHKAKLLTATEVMRILNVSAAKFYGDSRRGKTAMVSRLRAQGLKTVQIASRTPGGKPRVRYLANSLDLLIDRAAETDTPLG